MRDQPVTRQLTTHRTAQIQTSMLRFGLEPTFRKRVRKAVASTEALGGVEWNK
jgi:hypothetical protein